MNDNQWKQLVTMKVNTLVIASVVQGIAITILAIAIIVIKVKS